jgi:E3 ubiquitin-protein ligase makorin
VRTCPVCRVTTYFITPSVTWPQTQDEKQQIIDGYKSKLASIDCRNFNFGEGTCPFGTCCFYRHAYKDGTLEDRAPRVVAADEGEVKYISKVLLSDFLDIKQGRARRRRQ